MPATPKKPTKKAASAKKGASSKEKSESRFVVGQMIGKPIELLPKGKATIQVHHVTVDGEKCLDIRKYVKNERYEGHTAQGVVLPHKQFAALRELLSGVSLSKK